nr:unnamed protein product [Callosobruchus chinensis]
MTKKRVKIREFSKLIENLVSICCATEYGWLYLKSLEREKYLALKRSSDNYNMKMKVNSSIKKELKWWLNHIDCSQQSLLQPTSILKIYSDASKTDWGGYCSGSETKGFWQHDESDINVLELKAALYSLKSFAKGLNNCHLLLNIDNKSAISIINKMGSIKYKKLNLVARKLWQWCEKRQIFVFATYINTTENTVADKHSRIKNIDTEYCLSYDAFIKITSKLGMPEIDLFASYLNKKCERFVSWLPDPESIAVDAFTISWTGLKGYIFPPFSLLPKILSKIETEQAE